MRPVKILTDSCSDLSRDLREKYDIDYARMKTVYDGKEQWASLDFEYYTPKQLYDILRKGNRILTTQVPPDEFSRIFTEYLDKGFDIVYVGCSLKQSGSVNTGAVVARTLLESHPDANIFCIDSMNACIGEGMLAIKGAAYRAQGLGAKEIYDRLVAERKHINQYVTVHSLDYMKRAGRVKASAAFFGNLLGVKPILIADATGAQAAFKKVKGRMNSFHEIVSMLKESIIDAENQTVYLCHADCEQEEVDTLVQLVKSEINCKDVHVSYIGPIIGASIGPDAIGIWAYGKEVTFEG
ncbi:MAG: DegV family protein [Treponema sp.]|nr:DegV family protein [Treponema sp.]